MGVYIRKAQPSDAGAIYDINRLALGYDYPLEDTKRRVERIIGKPDCLLIVACDEESGRVIGYANASDYENTYSESMKNLTAIAVLESERGRGIGRLLLEYVENWARECGCAAVRLVSGFNREDAHRFYRSCGYTLRKNQKNFIKSFK